MAADGLKNWLNASALPEDVKARERYGLFEKFFEDGQLAEFGHPNGWFIVLKHGIEEGDAVIKFGSGGTPDTEHYRDGTFERFDAWSDNSRPSPTPYKDWVTKWIDSIWTSAERTYTQQLQATETKAKIAKYGRRAIIKPVK